MKKAMASYLCSQLSYQQNIRLMAEHGFDGAMLQWKDSKVGESKQSQIELCHKYGIDAVNLHCDYTYCNTLWQEDSTQYFQHLTELIEACDKYSIPVAVIHLSSSNTPPPPAIIGIDRLQKVVLRAESLGVKLAFENLRLPVFNKYVFCNIQSPVVGLCYDCGHDNVYCKNYDVLQYLDRPVWTTHLHDNDGLTDLHQLPFSGNVKWDSVIEKLHRYNVQEINLESHYNGNDYQQCDRFVQQAYVIADKLAEKLKSFNR